MQSGKTGSYLYTAFEMIRLGIVTRVVIICGSAETSLREQAKDDFHDARDEYQEELLDRDDKVGRATVRKTRIDVHFSNELSTIEGITDHTLVIHEECHMAQSKTNKPYKEFYKQNGFEGALLGDFSQLTAASNYILGVSATPFSEIVANNAQVEGSSPSEMDVELGEKYIHQMDPGPGYIGVPDFYRAGSIKFEAQKIEGAGDHFFQVLAENKEKYLGKYCIVRTFERKKTHAIIHAECFRLGYDCIHSFCGEIGIKDILCKKPNNPTVIHISGRCRMGQVIVKTHLGMVYESSNNPNADTLLQGLVGRVCGYNSSVSIDVYVSRLSEEHIADYSKAWTGEGDVELLGKISKAMNLSGGRKTTLKATSKDGIEMMPIHPIHIPGELLEIDSNSDLGWQIHQCLGDNPGLIKCQDDAGEIMKKLLDSGKFHKATRTNHEEDEKMLKASVRDHNRLRPGKLKAVQNCPAKFTMNEQPFILYKRKGSADYYLGGWVLYREIHADDEIDRPTPKVAPACNHVRGEEPSVEVSDVAKAAAGAVAATKAGAGVVDLTEDSPRPSCVSQAFSGTKIGSSTTDAPTGECEVYEIGPMPRMVCEVDTTDEFIATVKNLVKKGINSYRPLWMADNPGPVAVHLKKSVFSKDDTKKLEKQLRVELGIKLKIKGPLGRPSQSGDYRKVREISW